MTVAEPVAAAREVRSATPASIGHTRAGLGGKHPTGLTKSCRTVAGQDWSWPKAASGATALAMRPPPSSRRAASRFSDPASVTNVTLAGSENLKVPQRIKGRHLRFPSSEMGLPTGGLKATCEEFADRSIRTAACLTAFTLVQPRLGPGGVVI